MTSKRSVDHRSVDHRSVGSCSVRDRWSRSPFWAVLVALVLVATACGGDGDADSAETSGVADSADSADSADDFGAEISEAEGSDSSAEEAGGQEIRADQEVEADEATAQSPADEPAADDGTGDPSTAATPTGLTAADFQRKIVFTARVEVDVEDVPTASEEAVRAIEAVGGFVFGQETIGGAQPTSIYTFKVLPRDFEEALDALGGIGELVNQTVSADDVTERVVDLESRISVAELGVERLRTAAENTTSLDDFAELENQLLNRETDLELLRGQLRTIQSQVNLATITLVLAQDRVENNLELQVSVYEEHDSGLSCPGQQDLSIEAKTDLTICFELINTGDQTLTDLTLSDTALGIDEDTVLIEVFAKLTEPLAPGQSVIVAFETTPERDLRLRTRAGGQPTSTVDDEPAGPPVSTTRNLTIDVRPSEQDPTFSDGFDAGRNVVAAIWTVVRVVAGFLVPLLILLPFIAGLFWLTRRLNQWRARRRKNRTPQPIPPVAPAPPVAQAPSPVPPASQPVVEPAPGSPPPPPPDANPS